jgi:hypothetical protein
LPSVEHLQALMITSAPLRQRWQIGDPGRPGRRSGPGQSPSLTVGGRIETSPVSSV